MNFCYNKQEITVDHLFVLVGGVLMSLSMKQKDVAVRLMADAVITEKDENHLLWRLESFEQSFGMDIPNWELDVLRIARTKGVDSKNFRILDKWIGNHSLAM
jgi:hypothetical protein